MTVLTKWQLLPDDSPMHFHAAIPYSGRRFGTTPRFFLVAAGGVPIQNQEKNPVYLKTRSQNFAKKVSSKQHPGQIQDAACGGRPGGGHPRPGGATVRFPVGGAPCLKLRKFSNFGPVGLGNFGSRTIRKNIFRARPGPGRAQKYFCQNIQSVEIPEAPGRFLKKSEMRIPGKVVQKCFTERPDSRGFRKSQG